MNFDKAASEKQSNDLRFVAEMKVLTLSLASFIPVGAIALNHFSNVQSVNHVFKLLWRRQVDRDDAQTEGEAGNEITVDLLAAES